MPHPSSPPTCCTGAEAGTRVPGTGNSHEPTNQLTNQPLWVRSTQLALAVAGAEWQVWGAGRCWLSGRQGRLLVSGAAL